MTGNIKNPTTQDIEDYWNQCNKQQDEVREQKKEEPQEREEELKNQREEDRVFIQRITHQLLRVRRTIKRHIEESAFREDCIPERQTLPSLAE